MYLRKMETCFITIDGMHTQAGTTELCTLLLQSFLGKQWGDFFSQQPGSCDLNAASARIVCPVRQWPQKKKRKEFPISLTKRHHRGSHLAKAIRYHANWASHPINSQRNDVFVIAGAAAAAATALCKLQCPQNRGSVSHQF